MHVSNCSRSDGSDVAIAGVDVSILRDDLELPCEGPKFGTIAGFEATKKVINFVELQSCKFETTRSKSMCLVSHEPDST